MNKYDYDVVVIGGGAGGFTASKTALGFGKRTALIEKNKLGGECTHTGCIPSKALIKCAEIAKHISGCGSFGISLNEQKINTANVMKYVRNTVNKVYNSHRPETFEKAGIKVHFGTPQFIDKHTIQIQNKQITSNKFILSTGSSPLAPNINGLSEVNYHTNENIFNIDEIPSSMTILGSGPIGIEMCQAFARLGCKVTVLVRSRLLSKEEPELTEILKNKLESEGVKFIVGMDIVNVYNKNGQISVNYKKDGNTKTLSSDMLLIAAGRKPNLQGLNLENANVLYDEKGVYVNSVLQTSAENIYACGDIVMPYQFSHISEYEAVKATMNALFPLKRKVEYSNIVWVTFTDPEFAHLGMTEKEARKEYGDKVKIYRFDYKNLDRANTDNATEGKAKFIYLANGKILGAHILGARAGEIIHEAQILKTLDVSFYNINKVIHAYPTYSDITRQAGKKAYIDKLLNNPIAKIVKSFRK